MKYKHIIFDFDGTINDSREFALHTFLELTKGKFKGRFEHFREKSSKEIIDDFKDVSFRSIRKRFKMSIFSFIRLITQVQDEEYKFIKRSTQKELEERLPFYEGMLELLNMLKGRGYNLYLLSSNKEKVLNSLIERYPELNVFTDVVGGIKLLGKHSKLKSLMRKYKMKGEETVYIGDEVRDIEASKKVGIHIISVTWGYNSEAQLVRHNPSMVVNTVDELIMKIQ